jgi:hypothetical protein
VEVRDRVAALAEAGLRFAVGLKLELELEFFWESSYGSPMSLCLSSRALLCFALFCFLL